MLTELDGSFTSREPCENHTNGYCLVNFNIGSLTEENLLFLEAWKMVDRAYYDKTFNGQSWFRYRENALRNEPMNTREETCKGLDLPKERVEKASIWTI